MKKYLILLVLIANLGLGIQSFSAMTRQERENLEKQISEAYDKDDQKKLLPLVTKYVNEFPDNADYLNKLGVLYDNLDNYSEAEKYYLKAIERGNYNAISNLAYVYYEKEEYGKALKYYKEYQKIADNTDNYFWIGASYAELEDYKNAKEWFLKVTKFEKDGSSENRLGLIAENEGNQKEASSCKRRVHNVLAKTAEKLFYDENCKHTADHRHPKRRLHRHVHSQQKAGYQCTAVGNRHRFLHSFFIQIFRQGTDCHRNRNQKQCPKAEIPDSHAGCRGKGKQNGKHDFVCRHLGPRVWGR